MALTNTVSALSREKFLPVLVDNIFNSNALCLKLLKNADRLDGGAAINVPIEYAQNGNSGWLASDGSTATAQARTDIAQKSVWNWATAYNSVNISQNEVHINMGSNQVLSILKAKMKNAEKTIKDLFGTGLFAATGATDAGLTSLNGAGTLASGDYTAEDAGGGIIEDLGADTAVWHAPGNVDNCIVGYNRTLGQINSDSLTWWDSQIGSFPISSGTRTAAEMVDATDVQTFSEFTSTTNGVADGVKAMTRAYSAATIDNDQPDLIVTTQPIFDAYESSLQANKRFAGDATLADAGFQTLRFKGATVVVDSHCPTGQMYFLNTKYLSFKVHSKRFFAMEDWRALEASDVIQSRIFFMGQLVCSSPRMQALMVDGPAGY